MQVGKQGYQHKYPPQWIFLNHNHPSNWLTLALELDLATQQSTDSLELNFPEAPSFVTKVIPLELNTLVDEIVDNKLEQALAMKMMM